MAKMHSRARGKSGSKKPVKKVPSWAPYKEKEVEKLAMKYAKAGKSTSEIGLILRDVHGINSVKAITNKSISTLLKESKITSELPDDVVALIRRLIGVRQHLEKNIHDYSAKRGLILTMSKINRLVKYYKRSGRLPTNWTLDLNRLKMYLE